MNFISTAKLNEALRDPERMIAEAEAEYKAKVFAIAEKIEKNSDEKPIVLLSGPSGSGKTTTAKIIESYLDASGHETHTISLDDYFYRRADGFLPRDEEGNVDYESPLHIDVELLHRHMEELAACIPVEIPSFDFENQRRTEKTTYLARKPGEIVIFEGIHALNPYVSGDRGKATGIYVSVRTRVTHGEDVLHPSKIRLMRRLLRDKRHRGQSYTGTIERLSGVARGEKLFIEPYKNSADFQIDSFCPYELAVYRDLLLPGLLGLDEEFLEEKRVSDVIEFLAAFTPVSKRLVPENALIREFLF